MRLKQGDVEFDMLDENDLMWAEAAAIERVTGLTMVQISSMGQFCGCGTKENPHGLAQHRPKDPEKPDVNLVCTFCGCDQPISNLPAEVSQAMLWVSLKRAQPELSFKDVGQMPAGSFTQVEDEPDPTPAADSTESAADTSESSPKSSESAPGNGTS